MCDSTPCQPQWSASFIGGFIAADLRMFLNYVRINLLGGGLT